MWVKGFAIKSDYHSEIQQNSGRKLLHSLEAIHTYTYIYSFCGLTLILVHLDISLNRKNILSRRPIRRIVTLLSFHMTTTSWLPHQFHKGRTLLILRAILVPAIQTIRSKWLIRGTFFFISFSTRWESKSSRLKQLTGVYGVEDSHVQAT